MQNIDADSSRKGLHLSAAILSAILPGIGQLLLRKRRAGVGFLTALCILFLLYWPIRLPASYAGTQALVLGAIVLSVTAAWNALRSRSKGAAIASRAWLLLVVPLAVLLSFVQSNLFMKVAGFSVFGVPSTGMEHTITKGDRIVADFRQYKYSQPQLRDIVLFRREDTVFVKRVIATGGSTISGKEGTVFVDGRPLDEPYVEHIGNPPAQLSTFGPIKVPSGQLFVMGDNRDVSYDSRIPAFGFVSQNTVLGKALYTLNSKGNWSSALR